jgi:hypothetical protein
LAGVLLAYSSRKLPTHFNESKGIALAIYNIVLVRHPEGGTREERMSGGRGKVAEEGRKKELKGREVKGSEGGSSY